MTYTLRIDVHAHYIPSSLPELASQRSGFGPPANMRDSLSDLDQRVRDMDERGVDVQLVSAPPTCRTRTSTSAAR